MSDRRSPPRAPVLVFRHVPHEGLGTLAPALRAAGYPLRVIDIARGRPALPSPRELAALIVMGGPMGVYEKTKHPFLRREITYIRRALRAKTPVLGVCLGAQLIAHALGQRVYPNRQKEIGWYPLHRTAAARRDALFAHFPKTATVFQWHGDTFDLPVGATLLATSPRCRHQAFRWGNRVYGLQFHVEVDPAMVREWLSQPGVDRELRSVEGRARREIRRHRPARSRGLQRLAGPLFQGWAGVLNGTPPPRASRPR